ncbi:MAG: hypothetical protein SPI59_02735 [Finegoldia sp.]|nr:hypothetical protein [Finegoldia sp.]
MLASSFARELEILNEKEVKSDVEYNESKMENYLLNTTHSKGKSKAKFLKDVLGYKSGDGKILHNNLVNAVLNKKPVKV